MVLRCSAFVRVSSDGVLRVQKSCGTRSVIGTDEQNASFKKKKKKKNVF